jgi:hypothetical protein
MSPKGRPEGESAPKRLSAEGGPVSPKGRPEGESAPKRLSAEGSPMSAGAHPSTGAMRRVIAPRDDNPALR